MPSPRILDFGPDPLVEAAHNFGTGFSQQLFKDYETRQEEDNIKKLLSNIGPGTPEEDKIKEIFGSSGVNFEKKKSIYSAFDEVGKQMHKKKKDEVDEARKSDIKAKLKKAGASDVIADLYSEATLGGQTELLKHILDYNPELFSALSEAAPEINDQVRQMQSVMDSPDAGLTPSAPPMSSPTPQIASATPPTQRQKPQIPLTAAQQFTQSQNQMKLDQQRELAQQTKDQAELNYARQQAQPQIDRVEALRTSLPNKRRALDTALSGGVGQTKVERFGNFLADYWGLEPLRSAKGAQLSTAAKTYLFESLQKAAAGGRLNQWIEQRVSDAFLKAGRDDLSQEVVASAFKNDFDLEEKEIQVTDMFKEMFARDPEKLANINKYVQEEMKPFYNFYRDKTGYDIRSLYEKYDGYNMAEVPQGTPLTIGMADYLQQKYDGDIDKAKRAAERLGYTILGDDFYERI